MNEKGKCLIISDNGNHTSKKVMKETVPQLKNLNWKINVTTLSDTEKSTLVPRAIFQFMLENNDKSETTIMDLKLEELIQFYELLEKVQNDLDEISGSAA